MHDFERDVLKGGFNPVNKKIIAEKLIKFFDDQLKERVSISYSQNLSTTLPQIKSET